MKIQELIDKVMEEKPNSFGDEKLVSFINDIEADVAEQLHKYTIPVYSTANMDVDLLVPKPYDRLYVSYVKAMIDYANEEYDSYTNNAAQHQADYQDFINWVVRTNRVEEPTFPKRLRNVM